MRKCAVFKTSDAHCAVSMNIADFYASTNFLVSLTIFCLPQLHLAYKEGSSGCRNGNSEQTEQNLCFLKYNLLIALYVVTTILFLTSDCFLF